MRSKTEMKTATTVKRAAPTLRQVMIFLPPPVIPRRSTPNEAAVWPAIDATDYSATPMSGTT